MILYGGGAAKDGGSNGSDGGGAAVVLKKGPWTAAEDEVLAAYVREHGEGNWNAVQKNTGLARCGKSCRLRWANHLRPNLKKGAFSADEERLIIQLHAQLGNKWARMAAQLPGRTDNEIKNFWNTRLKRLQRQGLPLYPSDILPAHQVQSHHQQSQQMYLQPSPQPATPSSPLPSPTPFAANAMAATAVTATGTTSPSSFTFQTTTNNQLCPRSPTPCPTPTTPQPSSPLSSTPPPPPLSPSLSSPHQCPTLPLFALPRSATLPLSSCLNHDSAFSFPRPPPLLKQPSLRLKRFNADKCSNHTSSPNIVPTASLNTSVNNTSNFVLTAIPFSPLPKSSYASFMTLPYSSPATPTRATSYHNTNEPATFPVSSFSLNPSSHFPPTSSPNLLQTHFTYSSPSLQSLDLVHSVKSELPSSQTSHSTGVGLFDIDNLTENEKQNQNQTNTGLRRSSCELLEDVLEEAEALAGGARAPKRRQVIRMPEVNNNVLGSFGQCGSSNSICSSQGLKPKEEESLQMNAMQEDLAKLLDWGSDSGEISNGHSSVVTDDNLVLDVQQFASLFPVDPAAAAATDEHNQNPASCSWDNLPGIC